MASDVSICNMGLRHLGLNVISSLDENRQEARDCKLFYAQNRDTVLRDYPWNFAQKRRSLASFTIPDDYEGPYLYAYALPSDCLKPRKVYSPSSTTAQDFEIMRAPTGEKIIFTDTEEAILKYTMRVTDPTWFDAEFVASLALLMAATLARPLTKSDAAAKALLEQYRLALPAAEASNAKEDQPADEDEVPWITARTAP